MNWAKCNPTEFVRALGTSVIPYRTKKSLFSGSISLIIMPNPHNAVTCFKNWTGWVVIFYIIFFFSYIQFCAILFGLAGRTLAKNRIREKEFTCKWIIRANSSATRSSIEFIYREVEMEQVRPCQHKPLTCFQRKIRETRRENPVYSPGFLYTNNIKGGKIRHICIRHSIQLNTNIPTKKLTKRRKLILCRKNWWGSYNAKFEFIVVIQATNKREW